MTRSEDVNHTLVVLGAGLAGLSAAYHWPGPSIVYEAENVVGGTATSLYRDGFTYDKGVHVSFTKDEHVKSLFSDAVNGNFLVRQVTNVNFDGHHRFGHPGLNYLDQFLPHIARECLLSLIETWKAGQHESPLNYADWCRLGQGRYFADRYTRRYTRKFWCVEPEELGWSWAGKRVHVAEPSAVVDGLLGLRKDSGYYYTEFCYPKQGGFGAYANFYKHGKKAGKVEIVTGKRLIRLHWRRKILEFEDGDKEHFDRLIWTIPLPELETLAPDCPRYVSDACQAVRCTSICFVNIGLEGPPPISEHLAYFYDESIPFARMTIFSNVSAVNAPDGHSCIQLEMPYLGGGLRPIPPDDAVGWALDGLVASGLCPDLKLVRSAWRYDLKYGYVLYDSKRSSALRVIHNWFAQCGIVPAGRYGEWAYYWSDDSILSGRRAAERAVRRECK